MSPKTRICTLGPGSSRSADEHGSYCDGRSRISTVSALEMQKAMLIRNSIMIEINCNHRHQRTGCSESVNNVIAEAESTSDKVTWIFQGSRRRRGLPRFSRETPFSAWSAVRSLCVLLPAMPSAFIAIPLPI